MSHFLTIPNNDNNNKFNFKLTFLFVCSFFFLGKKSGPFT